MRQRRKVTGKRQSTLCQDTSLRASPGTHLAWQWLPWIYKWCIESQIWSQSLPHQYVHQRTPRTGLSDGESVKSQVIFRWSVKSLYSRCSENTALGCTKHWACLTILRSTRFSALQSGLWGILNPLGTLCPLLYLHFHTVKLPKEVFPFRQRLNILLQNFTPPVKPWVSENNLRLLLCAGPILYQHSIKHRADAVSSLLVCVVWLLFGIVLCSHLYISGANIVCFPNGL